MWVLLAGILGLLALAVNAAPLPTAIGVVAIVAGVALSRQFGPLEALWYVFVASIPLREPLSFDIHGTVSLCASDVLLLWLVVASVRRDGFRDMWRERRTLHIAAVIVLLSVAGLFTASRFFWGVASVYRIIGQIAVFVVATVVVRDGRRATRTLLAVLVGLVPAIAYGFYQSLLPFGADLPDWGNRLIAYGFHGERNLRVFSTFKHALLFSHYLSTGVGIAIGLLAGRLSRGLRILVGFLAIAAAYCNLFTYSIGGLLGMAAGIVIALVVGWGRRAIVLLLLIFILLTAFAPAALLNKAERVFKGEATTGVARLVTYSQALAVIRAHPFVGVGWGGIRGALEYDYRVTRAHVVGFGAENYFLQRGMALGVPGILLYGALCVIFFSGVIRSRDRPGWPRVAVLAAGVAFYVQAQSFPAAATSSNYLLWMLFALAANMAASERKQGDDA
jgi:O-antigen ligase